MSEVTLKGIAEQQTQLLLQIDAVKTQVDENREKLGDGTSAELKQEVNNMATKVSTLVEATERVETDATKAIERIEATEKELQELRQEKVNWNASTEAVNPYKSVYNHLFRKSEKLKDVGYSIPQEELMNASTSYGTRVPHKGSDIRDVMFPRRMQKERYQKALLTATSTAGSGAAGVLQTPEYQEQILPPAQETRTLLDEFPMVMTDYEKLFWRQEILSRRRGSAGVSIQSLDFTGTGQGNQLTEIEFEFEDHEEEMRTFGGRAHAALQILQDVGYLQAYISNQIEYEAQRDLSSNVLYGTNKVGSDADQARQLNSLNAASTQFSTSLLADVVNGSTHHIDVLKAAWLQATLTFIPPTKVLMHDTDYTAMCMLKDNDGAYLFVPNINSDVMLNPFGMPISTSTYINEDNFFVIPANQTMLCLKKGWESGISYENNDDFEKLRCTFRIYGRYGFIQFRPASQIKGTFSTSFNA